MVDPYETRTRIAEILIPEGRAMTRYRYVYGGEDDVLLEFIAASQATASHDRPQKPELSVVPVHPRP